MENGDKPVTRAELSEALADFRGELKVELDSIAADLREFIRDNQTELLRAFYGFTEATRLRIQNPEQNRGTTDSRLDNVEHRLDMLEKRILQDRVDPPNPRA